MALLGIKKQRVHYEATRTYIPNIMVRSLKLGKIVVLSEASTKRPHRTASKTTHIHMTVLVGRARRRVVPNRRLGRARKRPLEVELDSLAI